MTFVHLWEHSRVPHWEEIMLPACQRGADTFYLKTQISWATVGKWDVVRELHCLVLRWSGGAWAWQKLRSCLGYQLLLTSDDGSSSWLLNVLWTSSISGQMFHCNGGSVSQIPPFLGIVKAQKGEFWNRADYKKISREVHRVHAEGWIQVSRCPSEPKNLVKDLTRTIEIKHLVKWGLLIFSVFLLIGKVTI